MIEEIIQKPKRKYVRKPKVVDVVVPDVVVPDVVVPDTSVDASVRKPEPEVVPVVQEAVPEVVAESTTKKPRSQKQLDAFNRMREARLKKSAELQELKAFEKEKQLFEKEQLKVEKMEKKIVRKVNKTKSPPPAPQLPTPQPTPQLPIPPPILIHRPQGQVSNVRPILFV